MRIAIIAAMKNELEMLVSKLEQPKISEVAGFCFHQGSLEGHQLILLLSGIGKVNAAVATSLLIDKYKPEVLVNIGVAGSFSKELKPGDIVISTEVCHHDVNVTSFGYEIGQVPQMPHFYFADSHLLSRAQSIPSPNSNNAVKSGLTVSGDVFVQELQIADKIKYNFPNALAIEMEGAAIAQACYIFDTPFLNIRSISDIIGGEINKANFNDFFLLAATNSINFVHRLLKSTRGG
ncbi:5'-methylthioadenosine nucleosidase @ S-adenosylhomocysteine nucleosidase [Olavius algarvensis spirochete endosymbiont]|uniref:5'-methylthioadenosine/adenosylhomocysteine nucleosidase n=1 Tax=Olavius algarvensis spirochete endosymbiont TaxID=260710 RepID=UPI000F1F66ED|nr:5'-methylthioadenosine/adenosylhomocysteine nucleosidase [Olavius algarvensis spirochete endosymbiont]VDA99546.1 5'-methylthioadenosine nucleosidase @ S-adenosylhomocysteine nucleosidase [Olavius algarvensis spirochete endosymbiont]